MNEGTSQTVRRALQEIPRASWVDDTGEWQTSEQILSDWPPDRLDQPAIVGEDENGMTAIRALDHDGHQGQVLLTMLPPTGTDVPPEPVVRP